MVGRLRDGGRRIRPLPRPVLVGDWSERDGGDGSGDGDVELNVEGFEHGGWQEERCASGGGGGGWIS